LIAKKTTGKKRIVPIGNKGTGKSQKPITHPFLIKYQPNNTEPAVGASYMSFR
jgi:hypothetical protein